MNVVLQDFVGGFICGKEVVQGNEDVLGGEEPEPFDGDHDDVDLFAAGDAGEEGVGVAIPATPSPAVGVDFHGDVGDLVHGAIQGVVEGVDGHGGGGDDRDGLHGGGGIAAGGRGGCGGCAGGKRGAGCADAGKPQHVTAAQVLMEGCALLGHTLSPLKCFLSQGQGLLPLCFQMGWIPLADLRGPWCVQVRR